MNERQSKAPTMTTRPLVVFALGALGAQAWLPLIRFITESYRTDAYCIASVAPLLLAWFSSAAITALLFVVSRSRNSSVMGEYASIAGTGLTILGILLLALFNVMVAEGKPLLLILAGMTLGIGNCLLAMVWSSLTDLLSSRQLLYQVISVTLITCLLLGFTQLDVFPLITFVLSGCLALLSLACSRWLSRIFYEPPNTYPGKEYASPLLAITVSAACFGFIFALMVIQFSGAEHAKTTWFTWLFSLGGLGLAVVLLLIGHLVKRDHDILFVYRLIPIPIIIAFFPFNAGSEFSLVFAFSVSTLAIFCYMTIAPLVARENSQIIGVRMLYVSGATAFGLFTGATLGCLIALVVELLGLKAGFFINISAVVSMVLSVLATNIILTRSSLIKSYTAAILIGKSLGDSAELNMLNDRIYLISRRYHLTNRETEVLQILARGHNLARIQQELYISEGTAITHRRKIYQKLGVHSKTELLDLVANRTELE